MTLINNMVQINNYLVKNHLKYAKISSKSKEKLNSIDETLNRRLHSLRRLDFERLLDVPKEMKDNPIWRKAICELEFIKNSGIPTEKLQSMIR